jgi:hypothetical protein
MRLSRQLALGAAAAVTAALALPTPAGAQTGPTVMVRLQAGGITGQSSVLFRGFTVGAGIATRLGERARSELQIDFSFARFTGGPKTDGASTLTLEGTAIAPTILYIYNFARESRRVTPFVGGGAIFIRLDETETEVTVGSGGQTEIVTTTKGWFTGPQGIAGLAFAVTPRTSIRVEGRFGFSTDGVLVVVLGGVSF